MKRMIALLLAMLMLITISACSKTTMTNADDPAPAPIISTSTTPADSAEEPEETPAADLGATQLPICDELTSFTVMITDSGIATTAGQKDYNECHVLAELEKRTNVHWEWETAPSSALNERFSLVIASCEWPDVFINDRGTMFDGGTGGYDKYIEDEVIIDMKELVEQHAPNYMASYAGDEGVRRALLTDSGYMPGMSTINLNLQPTPLGQVVRADWMDALGFDTLVTYDDWEVFMQQVKETYGATGYYFASATGHDLMLMAGLGSSNDFMQIGGKATFGPIEDSYHDYLVMMKKWYDNGWISHDFAGMAGFFSDMGEFTDGNYAITPTLYTFYDVYMGMGTEVDPNFAIEAVPFPVRNEGDKVYVGPSTMLTPTNRLGGAKACISTTCEDPVSVVKWFDYLYSEEGAFLCNYGLEGDGYNMVDGELQVAEILTNNPDGLSYAEVKNLYILPTQIPHNFDWLRETVAGLSQEAIDLCYVWEETLDLANGYYIGDARLTVDESEAITSLVNDINTYVDEFTAKVIIGEESLDNWDTYVANIKAMGIDEAIACYQAAYDRYLTR